MDQPALGKKISELRKAKGMTQEELACKCKLNIRSLQRIESGEVYPRSYTIKAIFEALDYDLYEAEKIEPVEDIKTTSNAGFKKLSGQVYRYSIDLFNLKTNKMKKLMILSALTLCLVFVGSGFMYAKKKDNTNKLVGTWVLCNSHGEPMYSKNNSAEFKVITPETFTVLVLSKEKKSVFAELMGIYTLDKNIYTETITNAFEGMTDYPGTVNAFEIKFKDDLLIIEGQNNTYNQTWKKVNPEELKLVENK